MVHTPISELLGAGETEEVEFKRASRGDLSDDELVEAVVCLANNLGGTLLLGVNDEGTPTGCAPRHGDSTVPGRLEAMVRGKTEPSVSVQVEVVEYQGVEIVVVVVPQATQPTATSRGAFPKRRLDPHGEPMCKAMTAAEIQAMALTSGDVDFATQPVFGASLDDISDEECARYLRVVSQRSPASPLLGLGTEALLLALDFARPTSQGQLSIGFGAILLFGTESAMWRFFPNHEVQFQVLRGTRLVRNETLTGPMLAVVERLNGLLEATIAEEEFDMGLLRVSVPLVSHRAAREAVLNALVHRDYFERGAVRIEFNRDRFSVASPGSLPRGVTVANILDSSTPRSRSLATALQRAGLVERAGSGVDVMYQESLAQGHAAPSYSRTDKHRVVVDFELGNPDLAIARYVRRRSEGDSEFFDLLDLQILRTVKLHGDVALQDLKDELPSAGASLVPAVTRMVEQGTLEPRGDGRGRRYHLSAEFYKTAGEASAYPRIRGLSRSEMRNVVIEHVRVNGQVTRGEVAELCHISPTQARSLLKRMVTDGDLGIEGERRTSRYVLP